MKLLEKVIYRKNLEWPLISQFTVRPRKYGKQIKPSQINKSVDAANVAFQSQ